MKSKSRLFKAVDILYICMMVVPLICGITLKVLTKPPSEGISITGAQIYFTIPMPIQDLPVTESQVNSLIVMIMLLGLCLFLTHGLKTRDISVRQHLAEWIVESVDSLVKNSMGEYFANFSAFIASILALSGFSSLLSLTGLMPPTSDINVVGGWAVLVFVLITYYKMKCGPLQYVKSFGDPVPFLAPLNIITATCFRAPLSPCLSERRFRDCPERSLAGFPAFWGTSPSCSWVCPRCCPFISTCSADFCRRTSLPCLL